MGAVRIPAPLASVLNGQVAKASAERMLIMNKQNRRLFTSVSGSNVAPPTIQRSIRLNFMGDWGRANLHRALGWLGYGLVRLSGPHTEVGIWTGRGALDNVRAVGRGKIDVAQIGRASCRERV